MKKRIFGILIAMLSASTLLSQGLNNNYKIDNQDLKEVFDIQGINIYKFPLQFNGDKNFINVVVLEYTDGKLTDSVNFYESTKELAVQLKSTDYILHTTSKRTFFRCYFMKKDNRLLFKFNLDEFSQTFDFNFTGIEASGSRAFDVSTIPLTKRTRIMAYYGVKNNSTPMHCAQNDTNDELSKRMDKVVVIYIEPLKIKS